MVLITVAAALAAVAHYVAEGYAWVWANWASITSFIGSLGIVMSATNWFVKKMHANHPYSRFWKYADEAFGPDPENRMGKVVQVLDKLAANRTRRQK